MSSSFLCFLFRQKIEVCTFFLRFSYHLPLHGKRILLSSPPHFLFFWWWLAKTFPVFRVFFPSFLLTRCSFFDLLANHGLFFFQVAIQPAFSLVLFPSFLFFAFSLETHPHTFGFFLRLEFSVGLFPFILWFMELFLFQGSDFFFSPSPHFPPQKPFLCFFLDVFLFFFPRFLLFPFSPRPNTSAPGNFLFFRKNPPRHGGPRFFFPPPFFSACLFRDLQKFATPPHLVLDYPHSWTCVFDSTSFVWRVFTNEKPFSRPWFGFCRAATAQGSLPLPVRVLGCIFFFLPPRTFSNECLGFCPHFLFQKE